MLSFDRRLFLLIAAAAALAGCGFTPVYGPSGGGGALQDNVLVEAPQTRAGFQLTRELENRLGRGGEAAGYRLTYGIELQSDAVAISGDNVAGRYHMSGRVSYALRENGSGKVVRSGKADSFTGYSASGSTVATQAAERDAQARLMQILADQIITRLLAGGPLP